jgi:phosphoribosylanthranilate isomerase
MLPVSHRVDEIVTWAHYVEPDIVQVASYEDHMGYGEFQRLSESLRGSGFRVARVIPVGLGGELEAARRYGALADIIMLDTHGDPPHRLLKGFIGGTGRTHDWGISRRIVEEVGRPVILAGGLNPDNVTDAVRTVRPWGVDAATSLDIPGTLGRKDLGKVIQFIERAKGAPR